jgi:hypothetical protein
MAGKRSRDRAGIHVLRARTGLEGETRAGEARTLARTDSSLGVAGNAKEEGAGKARTFAAMILRIAADSLSSNTADAILTARFGREKETRLAPGPGSRGSAAEG